VVTPFLPGDSLLFVAGDAGRAGEMSLLAVIATLIAAALCGDNSNYWIGRWAGMRFRPVDQPGVPAAHARVLRAPRRQDHHPRALRADRAHLRAVRGRGGSMPYLRYLAFCVAGAVIWVGSLCSAGYFFGNIPLIRNNLTS
jgi:membrane-associated protein